MPIGSVDMPALQLAVFLKVCETHLAKVRGGEETSLDKVLIYTVSGEYGAEVGKASLLVGIASDGISASHIVRVCSGTLASPVLLGQTRLKTIYPWLGMVAAEGKRELGEDPIVHWSISNGYNSTMRASALNVESHGVTTSAADDYPIGDVSAILRARDDGPSTFRDDDADKELPAGSMVSFGKPIGRPLAVKGVLGGRLDFYPPKHPAGVWAVEDKANGWRGACPAERYAVDDDVDEPELQLYLPD